MPHPSAALPALGLLLALALPLKTSSCEPTPPPDCLDDDGDGYGDGSLCLGPDCDDADASVNPEGQELCEGGADEDCDGATDTADALDCGCQDADGDAWGAGPGCLGVDCDDADPRRNPGRLEVCDDGRDNDCDLAVDAADADCPPLAGPLELYPNIHTLGVNIELGELEDPEGDVSASVTWAEVGGASQEGFPLATVQAQPRLSGALFHLEPATAYAVQVAVRDPTTPALNFSAEGQATTRADPAAHPASRSFLVSPAGGGTSCTSSAPCELAYALSQVRAGEEVVMRGGIYHVGGLRLKRSGAPGAPITLRSADGEEAIWDGTTGEIPAWTPVDGHPGVYVTELSEAGANPNVVVADGERLYPYRSLADLEAHQISCILALPQPGDVDGFYRDPRPLLTVPFANPNPAYRKLYLSFTGGGSPEGREVAISARATALDLTGQAFIHLRGLTFRYYGVEPGSQAIVGADVDDVVIDGCTFEHNARSIVLSGNSSRNVIQNSRFLDGTDWDTYLGKATYEPESPQLCYQSQPPPYPYNDRLVETGGIVYGHGFKGRGTVVRWNTFDGYMDGFKGSPPSVAEGYTTAELDIYGNTVTHADDGFEVDGVAANVRVWGNTVVDCGDGISVAPPARGPVFLLNNVFREMRTTHATIEGQTGLQTFYGQPIKFDCPCEGGSVFVFHSTVYNPGDAWGLKIFRPTETELFYGRNNLIVSEGREALAVFTHDPSEPPIDLDWDLYWNTGPLAVISINGQPVAIDSLEAITAAHGWEAHGRVADPQLVDGPGGDLRLSAGSPAVDAGVIIPGINAGRFQGAAPDLGAFEWSPLEAGGGG